MAALAPGPQIVVSAVLGRMVEVPNGQHNSAARDRMQATILGTAVWI
ncbi:MAG: hypothetical protein JO166_11685 [Deltaproteobacteria bacterium]|nr:hypothetical protein [Deltaproteobacteria bacterium]